MDEGEGKIKTCFGWLALGASVPVLYFNHILHTCAGCFSLKFLLLKSYIRVASRTGDGAVSQDVHGMITDGMERWSTCQGSWDGNQYNSQFINLRTMTTGSGMKEER